jgi:hypothetical protein
MLPQPSLALVITSPSSSYSIAPSDDPGWGNVGRMSNGTGIYLGDGWVLSPYHVYRHEAEHSSIQLDEWYDEIPGTSRRIRFGGPGDYADLVMFRINGDPDLDLITIRQAALTGSKSATIISTGRIKDGTEQDWEIGGKTYSGFATSETRAKRWGKNWLHDYNGSVDSGGIYGQTDALWSRFDFGPSSEAQAVGKDSGGGAFIKVGDTWELVGMILLVGPNYPYDPHSEPPPVVTPATHAIYKSDMYLADLPTYYSQILGNRLRPLPGDADWNGRVDIVDFAMFRGSFGQTGSGIRTDFNYDEVVDGEDLEILENNFGMISGSGINIPGAAPPGPPVLVPEPLTIFVLVGAVPLLLKSSRRRGGSRSAG